MPLLTAAAMAGIFSDAAGAIAKKALDKAGEALFNKALELMCSGGATREANEAKSKHDKATFTALANSLERQQLAVQSELNSTLEALARSLEASGYQGSVHIDTINASNSARVFAGDFRGATFGEAALAERLELFHASKGSLAHRPSRAVGGALVGFVILGLFSLVVFKISISDIGNDAGARNILLFIGLAAMLIGCVVLWDALYGRIDVREAAVISIEPSERDRHAVLLLKSGERLRVACRRVPTLARGDIGVAYLQRTNLLLAFCP